MQAILPQIRAKIKQVLARAGGQWPTKKAPFQIAKRSVNRQRQLDAKRLKFLNRRRKNMNVKYLYNDNQAFFQFFQPNFVGAHGLREIRCEPGPDEVNGASGFRVQRSVNQTTCGLLSRIPSVENRPCHCPVHWLSPGLVLLSIDGPPAHKAFIAHQVIRTSTSFFWFDTVSEIGQILFAHHFARWFCKAFAKRKLLIKRKIFS